MNPQTRRGGSAAEGNLSVSETVGSTVSSANADCAGASVAPCVSVRLRTPRAPAAPRHPGWRRRQPARLLYQKLPLPDGLLESCCERSGRLQHGSQPAALHPVKCHGRGCQEHEFALSAAKPRTGCGPAKAVRLSERCTASAFLLPPELQGCCSRIFTEEREKIVSTYKPHLKWIK